MRALDGAGVAAAFEGHDASGDAARAARHGRWRVTFAPDADLDGADAAALVAAVARAARPTIVSLHWGHTGMLLPGDDQKRLAHRLVDAGAVAVVGHGPHTMQGTERTKWYQRYHRGVIAYSLGNFAFGCAAPTSTTPTSSHFTIDRDGNARDVVLTPIVAGLSAPPARAHDPGLHAQLPDLCADLSPRPASPSSRISATVRPGGPDGGQLVPEGYHTVTPYIVASDAPQAASPSSRRRSAARSAQDASRRGASATPRCASATR